MRLRFGELVRNKRFEMGISQEELAGRAGLHRTYVSDIERGGRNPSLESIEKLAKALEVSLATLFEQAGGGLTGKPELVDILLVEDDPRDVEMTMRAFKEARISNPVHLAADGAEALDFLFGNGGYALRPEDRRPRVILLDLNLPIIDGLEVLRRIKANPATRNIPVVILAGSDNDQDVSACRRLGVESYIVKPVGFQNFSEAMPDLHFDWALLQRSGNMASP